MHTHVCVHCSLYTCGCQSRHFPTAVLATLIPCSGECWKWMTCTVHESGVHSFDPLTNILFFQSSFRFTAKLRGSYRDFLYTSCPHIFIAFPIINVIHEKVIFFLITKNESTLTHHSHPKSSIKHLLAYLGVLSRCRTCSRFGKKYSDAYPSL